MTGPDEAGLLRRIWSRKRLLGLGLTLVGMVISDLNISSALPFWVPPVFLGLIVGFLMESSWAGIIAALGAIAGRILSIFVMVSTVPGLLRTLDLFVEIVGGYTGLSLPGGAFIVVTFSAIVSGLFAALGGAAGGSAWKLVTNFLGTDKSP